VPEATKLLAYLEVDAEEGSGTMPSDAELASVATPPLNCDAALTLPSRKMVFAQQKDANGAACEGPTSATNTQPIYNINCKTYHHDDPPMQLPLHGTEEWMLSSENNDHPFHIHVNSFTVCPGGTINGTPITTPHWRDTIFIRKTDTATGTGTEAITSTPLKVRTTYEDYAGKFVMHCHKLDHEDKGMMQQVQIQ
jgi:FtsP/CotA-like multicopper oxidase with cupredoxin domain